MSNERIYLEAFVIKDGRREVMKVIDLVDFSAIIVDKLFEGLEKAVTGNE